MPAMAARPLVAVLDTNVVIAGLMWKGPPYSLLTRATERQDIVLVTSPVLLAELADILALARFRRRVADAATSVEELVVAYRIFSPLARTAASRSSRRGSASISWGPE